MKHYDQERRETEGTMITKNAAIARYNLVERAMVDIFSGLMVLVGLTEAADRLRPPTASGASGAETEETPEPPPGESDPSEPPV